VTGRLEDLLEADRWTAFEGHYLQVTLTDTIRPREPMERLRRRFPHVLVLAFAPVGIDPDAATSYATRLRGRTDVEVTTDFVEHVRGPADPAEEALLRAALEGVRVAAAAR
jgi:exonuclease SbcD